ncbi:poliovirus receptor-like [Acomys russatus]|uniref:poliovirus receptor-like n=1 Tax=Acomys russatus TaxID=60746 RepID=UPI0021E26008|nr:poliovirus receptor-like [Acomys russatus]
MTASSKEWPQAPSVEMPQKDSRKSKDFQETWKIQKLIQTPERTWGLTTPAQEACHSRAPPGLKQSAPSSLRDQTLPRSCRDPCGPRRPSPPPLNRMAHSTRPSLSRVSRMLLSALLLLPFYCAPGRASAIVAVQVLPNATGFLGESVNLYCSLASENDTKISQITWMRKMPDGNSRPVAVFSPTKGPSIPESERVRFLSAKLQEDLRNGSLSISHLRAEDEGSYECHFTTFPTGSKGDAVRLQVLGKCWGEEKEPPGPGGAWNCLWTSLVMVLAARPKNTAEVLNPNSTSRLQDVAKCVSSGGRPPARITWSSPVNGTIREIQKEGPEPGTTTVISSIAMEPTSQEESMNIICRVEHQSLQEPDMLNMTLTLNYAPKVSISGYDNLHIGLTDVVLTCEGRSKPEPISYEWSTTTGPLPTSAEPQGNRLRIATLDGLNNTIIVCNVTNALGSRQAQVTILLKGKRCPQKRRGESIQGGPQGWNMSEDGGKSEVTDFTSPENHEMPKESSLGARFIGIIIGTIGIISIIVLIIIVFWRRRRCNWGHFSERSRPKEEDKSCSVPLNGSLTQNMGTDSMSDSAAEDRTKEPESPATGTPTPIDEETSK